MHDPEAGLFGREPQLARLQDAIDRARDGRPAFLLVTGEAGIGKTRLLRALEARAAGAGLRTLWGTAIESGRGVPYLPLLAPLRTLTAVDDPAAAARPRGPAPDEALGIVRRALRADASAPSTGAALEAARLVEAMFDVLARRPTLLVVDDVHWADDSTLTVLDYLAHRAVEAPLVVAAAARDEEPATLARLPIADGRRFARLAIERLSAADVRRQATAILGGGVPVARAGALHRRTAGNPFFVEQLLAQGDADDASRAVAAPASLRALVLRRVVGLAAEARTAVDALAVIGHATDVGHVSRIAGVDEEAVRRAFDASTLAGITLADDAGIGFRHPLFAEVIEAELAGPDRRALHAAAAIEAARAGADAAEVADHWWRAADRQRAWSSAREAATAAGRSYAFAEARMHLERALETWPAEAPGRVDALLEAARAAWLTSDPERALGLAQEAWRLDPGRVEAVVAIGSYAWDAGRRGEAVEAFAAARSLLGPDASPAVRARAAWGSGRAAVAVGDPAAGVRYGLDAAAQAIAIGDLVLASEGYALAGMSRAFEGSLDGAPWLDEAVRLALASGATFCVGHGFQFLVDLRGLEGSGDAALDAAMRGIEACSRLGLARTHGSDLRGRAALLLLDAGRLDEAEAILDAADTRAFPALATGLVAMRRGAFDRAEAALSEAATAGAIGGPGALGGWLELAQVELAWLRSDTEGARRWAAAIPFVPGIWGDDVRARAARWQARLGVGDGVAAVAAAGRHPDPLVCVALAAEVAAAMTVPQDAEAWRGAAAAWDVAGRPWEAGWARLSAAGAAFAARDSASGRQALEAVLVTAAALRSEPLRTHALELARRARVRPGGPSRERADPDAPTARELEVLELLAEGQTNPQIAERLFLSPKTVGIHVSRLFEKLGAHTRGEAVAIARRRGLIA